MRTPAGLLAITPGDARNRDDVRDLVRMLGEAFEAGLRAVSLRELALSDALLFELARETLTLARRHEGAWVGLHDSLHVALAAGADGVHLGFRSLPVAAAREVAAGRLALGYSAHARDDPRGAEVRAADYVTFGPVRETPSKRELLATTGFDGLRAFAGAAPRPVLALGGLDREDAQAALEAGAAGLAVIRALFAQGDVAARTAGLLAALERAGSRS